MRDDARNETLFLGVPHARRKIPGWVGDYNQNRPHSALAPAPTSKKPPSF
jgi:putative transposase